MNTKHGKGPDSELLQVGSGMFGFAFEIRDGMEEEANELRAE